MVVHSPPASAVRSETMRKKGKVRWTRSRGGKWAGEALLFGVAAFIDLSFFVDFLGEAVPSMEGRWFAMPRWIWEITFAAIYPALFLRWRYPGWVFALFLGHLTLISLLWDIINVTAGLLAALYPLARRGSPRVAGAALAAYVTYGLVMITLEMFVFFPSYGAPIVDLVWMSVRAMVSLAVIALLVWGAGRLIHLTEQRAEREKREQAAAAVRAERLHMARELHDIVSHSVSAMILQSAGARTLVSPDDEQVRAALDAIESTGVDAMVELHRLLGLLRSTTLGGDSDGDARPPSLLDLDSLVASTRTSGVDVEVVVEGHPAELDRGVGLAAYRVVQEALTNTIKHAGRGATARVHLRWKPDGLTLTVRDRAGFGIRETVELSSGHGLSGLAERVHLVGGTLEAGPVAEGFLIQAHLPARPPASQQDPTLISSEDTP